MCFPGLISIVQSPNENFKTLAAVQSGTALFLYFTKKYTEVETRGLSGLDASNMHAIGLDQPQHDEEMRFLWGTESNTHIK